MAPTVSTRYQKSHKSSVIMKKDKPVIGANKNSPSPQNCSIVSIKYDKEVTDDEHRSNIVVDLRDRLATTEFALEELSQKHKSLHDEIAKLNQLNEFYLKQIEQHKDTIRILSNDLHKKSFTNTSTQTETDAVHSKLSISMSTQTAPARLRKLRK